MQERAIEEKLRVESQKRGGLAMKFISPGLVGVPDRIVALPQGKIGFVELKAPGEKPRKIQVRRMEQLRKLGFLVYVLDDKEKIGEILDDIQGTSLSRGGDSVHREA
ncbi:VRR-NUC domain protein [Streptococcus sanguinis SK1057]|uniref:VRR-NUC domain-containing protein n=1 Tax=Streptococcus sanguinis TaxID=1305 RepID=UPI000204FE41|nr:VRR-NUC domain-containing protein [Streptococcus sanguinis]EGF07459.1 VRR-NUC domain protein [Streptococcus sanguinis SK1057]